MSSLAHFFIKNSKFTLILTLFIIMSGFLALNIINAENYPPVNFATATVTTNYSGANASDIETKVTKPLEDEIRQVTGLKDVKSISQPGLSKIIIRIDIDNVDVEEVMSDLQKAVDRVTDLPQDLREKPSFLEIKSEEIPIIEIGISGSNQERKRDLLADQMKEELEDSKGVLNVRMVGYSEREFSVQLSLTKLDQFHISVQDVVDQIRARNQNIPGGNLETQVDQSLIRVEGKVSNAQDLKDIVIRSNFSGQKILLSDVAEVNDSREEDKVLASLDGRPATFLIVTKKAGSDTISLVQELEKKVKRFQESNPDFKIIKYYNEAEQVENKLDVLSSNAFSGLALVIFFLLIFLPGKIGVMASLSLPIAVLATFGLMPGFGMNLNTITILALVIALGMLVDNSVVITENYVRLRKEGEDRFDAAVNSVRTLWLPISATAFTTIAAFLPMLVTTGVMGEFIKYIPIIVTFALVMSLVESFFLLPMRLVSVDGKIKKQTDWFQKVIPRFEKILKWSVENRYIVLTLFSATLVLSFFLMFVANKFILFPPEQTEIYLARMETARGASLDETNRINTMLAKKIRQALPQEIKHLVVRSGISNMGAGDPKGGEGDNQALQLIYVTDETKNNKSHFEVLNKLRQIKMDEARTLTFEAQANGPPVGSPLDVTFRSNKPEQLANFVEIMKSEVAKIPGVFDIKDDILLGEDEIYIQVDYALASRIGLDIQTIGDTIRTAFDGNRVSNVTLENKEVELFVKLSPEYRQSLDFLKNIKIGDRNGNLIPLSKVAKFKTKEGSPIIKRFDFKRSITLTGNINEEMITSQKANSLLQEIYEKYRGDFPSISMVYGGEAESTKESLSSLFNALILALIAIFALLVFLFNSYLRPAIIMSTIPLGLLGFSVAFYLHGRPVSFMSLIGLIGLAGIIVNSGIVLMSFIEQLRAEGKMPLKEILIKSSGLRLRAVVVTSLTTISGLLPTAYGIGGTDATLVPMTMAMAWGLTSGTILTLIWVPCAYAITEDINDWTKTIWKRKKLSADQSLQFEQSSSQEAS